MFQKEKTANDLIFRLNVYAALKHREVNKKPNKEDAVRRCLKVMIVLTLLREKLKHIVSKDAFNIDGLGKK